jgi:hypothetical protein
VYPIHKLTYTIFFTILECPLDADAIPDRMHVHIILNRKTIYIQVQIELYFSVA